MLKLGMVGWRGMVGSVLMDRMKQEDDFKFVSTTFFSTSNAGGKAPEVLIQILFLKMPMIWTHWQPAT